MPSDHASSGLIKLNNVIAIDEVGVGCIAGPMCAAAVVVPLVYFNKDIKDSKKVSETNLSRLALEIAEECKYAIHMVSVDTINRHGVWGSWDLMMAELIYTMRARHGFQLPVVIDGSRIPPGQYRTEAVVKGDAKYFNIAAASILAKWHRRAYMRKLHKVDPRYGYDTHEGYGVAKHTEALLKHGQSRHHRRAGTATILATVARKQIARA